MFDIYFFTCIKNAYFTYVISWIITDRARTKEAKLEYKPSSVTNNQQNIKTNEFMDFDWDDILD